jgi:hypothetical protein
MILSRDYFHGSLESAKRQRRRQRRRQRVQKRERERERERESERERVGRCRTPSSSSLGIAHTHSCLCSAAATQRTVSPPLQQSAPPPASRTCPCEEFTLVLLPRREREPETREWFSRPSWSGQQPRLERSLPSSSSRPRPSECQCEREREKARKASTIFVVAVPTFSSTEQHGISRVRWPSGLENDSRTK